MIVHPAVSCNVPVRSVPDDECFLSCAGSSRGESESNCEATNCEKKEVSATGAVKLNVYYQYWKSVGHGLGAVILLSVVGMQVSVPLM